MIELLPYGLIFCLPCIVLVEVHDVVSRLWVLFLLLLRDTAVVK